MIDAPSENIQVSNEDALKIELVQNRLSNLQAEVLYATKRLATITEEENTARAAREYSMNEKVKIDSEVAALKSQKEDLEIALRSGTSVLEEHQVSHENMRTAHSELVSKSEKRIKDAEEAESALAVKTEQLITREQALEEQRSEVENAQQAFLRALESVTWA